MPEVIVKYKSAKALKAIQDLSKLFDIVIEKTHESNDTSHLPITFAAKPDIKALAGIWQNKDITLEQLRKEAWGERI